MSELWDTISGGVKRYVEVVSCNAEDNSQLTEVITMFKRRHLRCSFCGKKDTEISKLVAGPRVYICDECVAIVSRIMESDSNSSQPPKVEASVWRKLLVRARQLLRGGNAQRASIIPLSD